ncbi:hypothetical protein JSQ98_13760 [Leucobacter sp. Marseille-Q4368]|uniref:Uncharacterized protein n=1 Tax=Leucobacter manosquensis TaxID=2810611 RepID=A0ABS5M8F5_9MICO|nr:hypothetical protein [Leucobacter manosquensis]MBS3183251.1 hypothetical protein [Leucobacter manosquensis]
MSANGGEPPRERRSRRASRPAAPGVDQHPSQHPLDGRAAEDLPEGWGEPGARGAGTRSARDEALSRDRPPHWG